MTYQKIYYAMLILFRAAILVTQHPPMKSLVISAKCKQACSNLACHWLSFALLEEIFFKIFSSENYLPVDTSRKNVSCKVNKRSLHINCHMEINLGSLMAQQ